MKYINVGRTDEECLENVIKYMENNDTYRTRRQQLKDIRETKKLPISDIRYIDNDYRIFKARNSWAILRHHFLKT